MKRRHVVNSSAFSLFSDFFFCPERERKKNRTKKSFTACSLQKFFSFFFSFSLLIYLFIFFPLVFWQCDDYQWLNARYCLLYCSLLLNANEKINEKIKRLIYLNFYHFYMALPLIFCKPLFVSSISSSYSFISILCFDIISTIFGDNESVSTQYD